MRKISLFLIGTIAIFGFNSKALAAQDCEIIDGVTKCQEGDSGGQSDTQHVSGNTFWQAADGYGWKYSIWDNKGKELTTTEYQLSGASKDDFIATFANNGYNKEAISQAVDNYLKGDMNALNNVVFNEELYDGDLPYIEAVKGVLKDFGVKDEYISNDNLKNLFGVVEPTYKVYIDGKKIVATPTELAEIVKNSSQNTKKVLDKVIGQNFACSMYLGDGTLSGNGEIGQAGVEGWGTDGVYFGGKMSISTDVYDRVCQQHVCTDADKKAGICSGSGKDVKFTLDYILNNLALGKQMTWLNVDQDINKECDPEVEECDEHVSCEIINNTTGFGSYNTENLYNNQVEEISNLINAYAAIKNTSEERKIALAYWYLENCTIDPPPKEDPKTCEIIGGAYPCGSFTTVDYQENDGTHGDTKQFVQECGNSLGLLDGKLSNQYCQVYCFEDLKARLFSQTIAVVAGRYVPFSNYTNNVKGSRTCYTDIQTTKFKSDLTNADRATLEAYKNYLLEQKKSEMISKSRSQVDTESRNCRRTVCAEHGYVDDSTCSIQYNDEGNIISSTCGASYGNCTGEGNTKTCKTQHYDCVREETRYYDYYPGQSYSISVNGQSKSGSFGGWCSDEEAPTANVSTARSNYENAKKTAYAMIEQMYKCLNWKGSDVYEVGPSMNLDYTDGVRYYYNSSLSGSISYIDSDDHGKEDDPFDGGLSWMYECSGGIDTGTCNKSYPFSVMPKKSHTYKRSASSDFYLNSVSAYKFIQKGNNLSQHEAPAASFITLAGNLPVAYSASNAGDRHINIDYSGLGHLPTNRVDTYFLGNEKYSGIYGKWYCTFSIDDKLITSGGLKLIYRPIDLHNPFPDIDGQTRQTGSNWCSKGDCSTNNKVVQENITGKTDVYGREPMYTFILTPSTIKRIREYNRTTSYDDFNLKCDEEGNSCVSSFLTNMINGSVNGRGVNVSAGGACLRTRETNNFYACQPKAN